MTDPQGSIQRPQRWDMPFDEQMSDRDVDQLLMVAPFNGMNADNFPPSAPLRGLLRNDTRILKLKPGDIVVREGDYGNSAFFILSGTVRVVVDNLPPKDLGRRELRRKGLFDAFAQLWRNPKVPEFRRTAGGSLGQNLGTRTDSDDTTRVFLQDVPAILRDHNTVSLETGTWFGEIAALGRTPRTATVLAQDETTLLEVRWQGLRDLRRRDQALKTHIDDLYRERSLKVHLQETPLFGHLEDAALAQVMAETRFQTYGNFDWYTSYKRLVDKSEAERIADEPIIAEEGHYANGIYLIRSGFARLSQRYGNGHQTLSYLGRGQIFGLDEAAHNWSTSTHTPLHRTLRAVGYVDVLFVPTRVLEQQVFPTLPEHIAAPLKTRWARDEQRVQPPRKSATDSATLEFLVENRFINGTAAMVIDLERCTRCDDCVRACAMGHSNNPRFIRHGKRFGNYMVANACMHCADPVCMIGCPTGAIHRGALEGQISINDRTCIGCATCANSCPYDNIRMVDIRHGDGALISDRATGAPIQKATKCDLCIEQIGGPACERACPHDALQRVDIRTLQDSL